MYKVCVNYHQYLKRGFLNYKAAFNAEQLLLSIGTDNVIKLPKFNDLVKLYLEYQKTLVKDSTYLKNVTSINCHIIGIIPNVKVCKLNYHDFMYWRKCLNDCHLKKGNTYIRLLISIFDFCKKFYDYNCRFVYMIPPFKDFSFGIEKVNMKCEILTKEDFIKFLFVIKSKKFKLLFMTAFVTGCRIGEIRGLQINSLISNKLYVYQQASSKTGKGHTILTSPKSKKSFRYYLLPEFLVNSLNDYIFHNKLEGTDFLFSSSRGKNLIMGETTLNKFMKEACLKANIDSINFHMFRHTEATLLSDAGVDPKVIASYLGHSSESVTKKYYIHQSEENKEKVAKLLNNSLSEYI
jgi:integrase